mmetsp:Transcript_6677/g.15166  ORF Transcript_6677/g.15166 Transcript_6677/m.15166 type:complete len:1894 (+) Transcript_6677:1692-7373(+)
MRLLSLLLFLGAGILPTTASSVTTDASQYSYFDEWCEERCSTWDACNELFGNNHADLRLRVRFPIDDGSGRYLILDKYFGTTISRQSFETQFVLDVATALETSPCRIHIISVFPEGNENYWDAESVFITFRVFPADATFVAALTKLIQEPNSTLYNGHVTRATDALYGLVALRWDYSLRLMYSISVVGGSDVVESQNGSYLNHGSLQSCVSPAHSNSTYCAFETFLTNDMERTLGLQSGQFIALFVKEADMHSVIVSFRLVPEASMDSSGQDTAWVQSKVTELLMQISDSQSLLYSGNVTFKTDPTWGVSGLSKQTRQSSKYLSRPAPSSSSDAYERCKTTHRCPRAWSQYNQSSAQSSHTFQKYLNGEHVEVPLFLDFEDWRRGIRGWEQSCRGGANELCFPASLSEEANDKPVGAHWSPFDFDAIGPNVPTFGNTWNNGLVLNKKTLELDIKDQMNLIAEYESLVTWMDEEFRHRVSDDAMLRSRKEIRENITNYTSIITAEKEVLAALAQSQCSNAPCNLTFNTSDVSLRGAVNATGVIATTPDGTEVALWAFESIDIDENVNITVTGQRAMALVSRSSVRINTTLDAKPGTLGGFPGGFSVARRPNERLVRVCNEEVDSKKVVLDVCKGKLICCPGDQPISELKKGINSNNINGPGSPSTRVYLMTIQTSARIVNELVQITTRADRGQTISGGFRLHFNGYTSPLLPHDITASEMKRKIEDSLNPVKRNQLSSFDRTGSIAGIGAVDVTRESFGSSRGYRWNITFTSAVGNIGEDSSSLNATNLLVSKGARVDIETIQHGNSIGGKFALRFLGNETSLMRHDVSALELEEILSRDIPSLSTVHILRNDPTGNCNDGYCHNGADRSGGYTWTLTLTTQVGNNSPFSPTSRYFDDEGDIVNMTALNYLTGCVDSQCPTITIEMGHSKSHNTDMRSIFGKKPFSLAYGGAGAGHGGHGGDGFRDLPSGNTYGNERISNLHGGSGGGVGVNQPFQLGIFKQPRGRGGSGGGAIEIVATNDIIIGSNAVISCDGEQGANGYMSAGGGGSGGTILLAAGGVVQIEGKLSVTGGAGGHKKANLPNKVESFGGHGGGGSGGRIAVYGQSVLGETSTISLDGGSSQKCKGDDGTHFAEAALDTGLTVDHYSGAAGTRSSLLLIPRAVRLPFNSRKKLSSTKSGPEYDLGASVRPSRVSFYFLVENPSKLGWDATFELRESRWSYLSSKTDLDYTAVVGIIIGKELRHGTNYFGMPFDDEHIEQLRTIKSSVPQGNVWTKVDIRFDWKHRTHDVYVDDVRLVQRSPFQGESFRAISVGNYYEGGRVWFDEIYIGEDTAMGFLCPLVLSDGTLQMDRPLQMGWKMEDIGGTSSLRPIQRHESHVSRRAMYQRDDNKFVVPFDGQGENDYTSDVKFRSQDGDRIHEKGHVLAGSLLRLPRAQLPHDNNENSHGMHPDTFIWYGEHDHFIDPRHVSGAVTACSTQDFVTWRNEGTMIHYTNLTDMVNGPSGPLHAEKPKVLYNNSTQTYVMWMIINNGIRELGMAGVAVSDYPNGPFEFVRSLYPDGNQTHDQTLFQDDNGAAYLFRTYYDTVEYAIPKAVMQPTWESVKNADGSTNFALSYHRAEYDPGYDDFHDIYLQRWRTEDQPWKVVCVNRLTHQEREVPYGKEHLNFDGDVCQDPFEYKKVLGQGSPLYENSKNGIQSRFLDPNDPANNVWIPTSVPGVKGQPWKANYEDGACGKRKINDDMQPYDPNLPFREQPDRGDCSNIADNPIHPTLPDERIGPATVTERRRAKYVAVSRLTDDYLDTSGIIKTFEGELDGADLLSLVREYNNESSDLFGWKIESTNDEIGTTMKPQVHDNQFAQSRNGDLEHHQYEKLFNDRSFYSPACVYDSQCPTNFK